MDDLFIKIYFFVEHNPYEGHFYIYRFSYLMWEYFLSRLSYDTMNPPRTLFTGIFTGGKSDEMDSGSVK